MAGSEPRTLTEIFADQGWAGDDPVSQIKPEDRVMGDAESVPTQMVDIMILDTQTADLVARFSREDGISQGQVLAAALRLYDAARQRRKT